MSKTKKTKGPTYTDLIIPTFTCLKELGGSGNNSEICTAVIKLLQLPNEIIDESHLGSETQSELQYQLAWARTYLKNFGVIVNSSRSVWSITPQFINTKEINAKEIVSFTANKNSVRKNISDSKNMQQEKPNDNDGANDYSEFPDGTKPWITKLSCLLKAMDPFAFERLSQLLLRESGFTDVIVTKKTGDGGIDGFGKFKINGVFTFNVAFQCKRYKGLVSASDVRDFRGSLTTDIEKAILITTGTFSKVAIDEASIPGKQKIDLINGEEFINKLLEYNIGVKEIKAYEIDEDFFIQI